MCLSTFLDAFETSVFCDDSVADSLEVESKFEVTFFSLRSSGRRGSREMSAGNLPSNMA